MYKTIDNNCGSKFEMGLNRELCSPLSVDLEDYLCRTFYWQFLSQIGTRLYEDIENQLEKNIITCTTTN